VGLSPTTYFERANSFSATDIFTNGFFGFLLRTFETLTLWTFLILGLLVFWDFWDFARWTDGRMDGKVLFKV
jgi:hypothetical protein